jgi:hypothetical protein
MIPNIPFFLYFACAFYVQKRKVIMSATNMKQILPLMLSSLTCSSQQIVAVLLGQYHQEKCLASF